MPLIRFSDAVGNISREEMKKGGQGGRGGILGRRHDPQQSDDSDDRPGTPADVALNPDITRQRWSADSSRSSPHSVQGRTV